MRKRTPDWVWAAVAVGLVGVMVAGAVAVGLLAPDPPAARKSAVYGREEFRAAVLGKTPEQVVALVGKPSSTQDYGDSANWYYKGRTRDPVTGGLDGMAQVVFEKGVATAVNFH